MKETEKTKKVSELQRLQTLGMTLIRVHDPLKNGGCTCGAKNCGSVGKHPISSGWQKSDGDDPLKIGTKNYGILTGRELTEGQYLFVLDVDSGRDGDLALKELEDRYGELPQTMTVITGNGYHYYFISDKPVRNFVNHPAQGIDIRGKGGFVVGPGSKHYSGKTYELDLGQPDFPVTAPDWLLDELETKSYAQSAGESDSPLVHGGRNEALTKLAGSMRARNMGERAILAALLEENTARCKPPLTEEEVRTIASSAARNMGSSSDVWEYLINKDQRGRAIINDFNCGLFIQHHYELGGKIRLNERSGMVEWYEAPHKKFGIEKGEVFKDGHLIIIQGAIGKPLTKGAGCLNFTLSQIHNAVTKLAEENRYDPVKEYLEGLQWDGKRRLKSMFPKIFKTRDTVYEQMAGYTMMLALVARGMEPGSKVDTVWVLEGKQGVGKSRAVAVLGGEYNASGIVRIGNKDLPMEMAGSWTYELAEFSGLDKYNAEEIKAFISTTEDKIRKPYARMVEVLKRKCVFIATTNRNDYLKEVENRRFIPVVIEGRVDLKRLKEERDQLFAEAVHEYKAGGQWWLDESTLPGYKEFIEELRKQTEDRAPGEPWLDVLGPKLHERMMKKVREIQGTSEYIRANSPAWNSKSHHVPSVDLMEMLEVPIERRHSKVYSRLKRAMASLGWKSKTVVVDGIKRCGYVPLKHTLEQLMERKNEDNEDD